MYKTNIVNADSFLIYEITDEKGEKIDSVVITKYTSDTILHFYKSKEDYIDEYENKMKNLADEYEDMLDFDDAIENRSNAEFILFSSIQETTDE